MLCRAYSISLYLLEFVKFGGDVHDVDIVHTFGARAEETGGGRETEGGFCFQTPF